MIHQYRSSYLSRSAEDKKIAGVCGGLARHYGHSPWLVRLVVLLSFFCIPIASLIAYGVAALVMPTR
jgi:phage shock protein PspC (stress-responsive transcriptional regulator)